MEEPIEGVLQQWQNEVKAELIKCEEDHSENSPRIKMSSVKKEPVIRMSSQQQISNEEEK